MRWYHSQNNRNKYSGGDGTKLNPYLIATADDLRKLSEWANPIHENARQDYVGDWEGKYFSQVADIDLSDTVNWNGGEGFSPIGESDNFFTSSYNGGNKMVRSLYINSPLKKVGFFGYCDAHLSYIKCHGFNIMGVNSAGLVLSNRGLTEKSLIMESSVTGEKAGGFMISTSGGICRQCASLGGVTIATSGFISMGLGGFTARSEGGTIQECFSTGLVRCERTSTRRIMAGGFIGVDTGSMALSTDILIKDCYTACSVHSENSSEYGGFIGVTRQIKGSSILRCYSTGVVSGASRDRGGFIGEDERPANVSACFWDKEASGMIYGVLAKGKTTAEMQQQSTYEGWDFENVWAIAAGKNGGYPYLRWAEGLV